MAYRILNACNFLLTSLPKELLSKTEWLAYPNLASGDCKVIFPSSWQGETATLILTDVLGRNVLQTVVKVTAEPLLLPNLSLSGTYWLQVGKQSSYAMPIVFH